MSPIRLSSFLVLIMLMLTSLLEARNLHFKQPNYQGVLEAKVAPQSNNYVTSSVMLPKVVKDYVHSTLQTEVESDEMKLLKGRKLTNKGALEEAKPTAKIPTSERGSEISAGSIANGSSNGKLQASHKDKDGKSRTKGMTPQNKSKQQSKKNEGFNDSLQKLESHDLEAANEVWTLMNKDYPGNGNARHNPPINNR